MKGRLLILVAVSLLVVISLNSPPVFGQDQSPSDPPVQTTPQAVPPAPFLRER